MIVLDTSVIVKWYNKEEGTDKALKIQKSHIQGEEKISVPDLMLYELANAIRFSPANDLEELIAIIDNLSKLKLNIILPTTDIIKEAGRISFRYKISIFMMQSILPCL
ncbi:MAG: type II toxin-antitoxin system VapC family toxin [bacterium]